MAKSFLCHPLRNWVGVPQERSGLRLWHAMRYGRLGRVPVATLVVPASIIAVGLFIVVCSRPAPVVHHSRTVLTKCVKHGVPPVNLEKPYSTDRGQYIIGRGLYQMDDHPLSLFHTKEQREKVLDWVQSPPSACVAGLFPSQPTGDKKLLLVHTSLEDDHLSMLLNQAVSLHRVGLGVKDVFLIVYDYGPISTTARSILNDHGFQYASAWDFAVPPFFAQESKLSPYEFFFVRDVIILKILKMGFRVLQADTDVVFLNKNPWSGFDPDLYSIEAASEGSPAMMREKWGYTFNCGYMCIAPDRPTVAFYEKFLIFSFDFVVPIDQWAFNYFLEGSRVQFDVHRTPNGQLVNLPADHGPLVGNLTFGGNKIFVRGLEPRSYLTGRWLNYALKSSMELHEYAAENFDEVRCVHPTHMQQGLQNKINWLMESKLWFLKEKWKDILPENLSESIGNLDNGVHAPGW